MNLKKPLPLNCQDKLKSGVVRTENDTYVDLSFYGLFKENRWEGFAKAEEQDKLKDGLVKLKDYSGIYLKLDALKTEDFVPEPPQPPQKLENVQVDECFVATAVYGDVNSPQVQVLRDFRDQVLSRNPFGEAFVQFYYSGAGKRTADFIRQHLPSTIPAIRKGLDFVVESYRARRGN